jgi:hypothetical protein
MPATGEHAELSRREAGASELTARELGEHFARISEYLLGDAARGCPPETATGDLAIGNALLAIYWELRHQSAIGMPRSPATVGLDRIFPRKQDVRRYRPSNGQPRKASEPGS